LRRFWVIFTVLWILAVLEVATNASARAVLFRPNAIVEVGDGFGVSIGSARSDALDGLRRALRHAETKSGGTCLFREFSDEYVLDVFRDDTWRRGTVCIASRDDVVVAVVWMFNPFMP